MGTVLAIAAVVLSQQLNQQPKALPQKQEEEPDINTIPGKQKTIMFNSKSLYVQRICSEL